MNIHDKAQAEATRQIEQLRADFTDLEKEVNFIATLLARHIQSEGVKRTLDDIVFRSMMTGAAMAVERYHIAEREAEAALNKMKGKANDY